jgi:hypothetical protein
MGHQNFTSIFWLRFIMPLHRIFGKLFGWCCYHSKLQKPQLVCSHKESMYYYHTFSWCALHLVHEKKARHDNLSTKSASEFIMRIKMKHSTTNEAQLHVKFRGPLEGILLESSFLFTSWKSVIIIHYRNDITRRGFCSFVAATKSFAKYFGRKFLC